MPNVSVTTSIPVENWHQMDKLVKQGKYRTMSECVRIAIQRHLEEMQK